MFLVLWQGPSTCISFCFLWYSLSGSLGQESTLYCRFFFYFLFIYFFIFFFFFFFLAIITRSGLLTGFTWSVCISKFQRILCVSFFRMIPGLCLNHLIIIIIINRSLLLTRYLNAFFVIELYNWFILHDSIFRFLWVLAYQPSWDIKWQTHHCGRTILVQLNPLIGDNGVHYFFPRLLIRN